MKMVLEARVGMSQDLQLICKCCGQPYHLSNVGKTS